MDKSKDNVIKIIVLGSSSVGKTCILVRGFDNRFVSSNVSTVGIDFKTKFFKFDDTKVKVNYIDTAGQEIFKSISLNYLKGADGAILVFDITNKETFDLINSWIEDIKENNQMNIGKILIGNKVDLEESREVDKSDGEQLAKKLECPYFETSAKTGENIIEALDEIAKITYLQWKQANGRHSIRISSSDSVKSEKEKEVKKGGCCGSSE